VAIVDDGGDPGQPELVPNLDMASGFDFGENDPDPIADDSKHGVQTALMLGARGNDGVGMAGVAWNVRIMPLKVRRAGTRGRDLITKEAEVAAYRYAALHGARVVGASLGGTTRYRDSILRAIQSAPNTLRVVSAGQSWASTRAPTSTRRHATRAATRWPT
jgi:subtilisin family serine protease